MSNYAESIAYWYLRLNGFFPLHNFVLHRSSKEPVLEHSADCDLLAIRFPFVYEPVGGRADDWDSSLKSKLGIDITKQAVCVIAEVKSGKNVTEAQIKMLKHDRLLYVVKRTGIFPNADSRKISRLLLDSPSVTFKSWTFVKLVVFEHEQSYMSSLNAKYVLLNDMREFMVKRIEKYKTPKNADRLFFPDTLIQEMIAIHSQPH